jgi:hypothetical protein
MEKSHVIVVKRFEQEMTHLMIRTNETQLAKKRPNVFRDLSRFFLL